MDGIREGGMTICSKCKAKIAKDGVVVNGKPYHPSCGELTKNRVRIVRVRNCPWMDERDASGRTHRERLQALLETHGERALALLSRREA